MPACSFRRNVWWWSRRQESNLYLALRRRSFYPLNYGGESRIVIAADHRYFLDGLPTLIKRKREDQIDRAALARLAAQEPPFGELVIHEYGPHGACQAVLVGGIELVGNALAKGEGGASRAGVGVSAATEAELV